MRHRARESETQREENDGIRKERNRGAKAGQLT